MKFIKDEKSFYDTAKTFYDNHECNSIDAFNEDIYKIVQIKTHLVRYSIKKTTNYRLMMNHFISFVNCFGIISEEMLKFRISEDFHPMINSLFAVVGSKLFDGTFKIHEEFFIDIQKSIKKD